MNLHTSKIGKLHPFCLTTEVIWRTRISFVTSVALVEHGIGRHGQQLSQELQQQALHSDGCGDCCGERKTTVTTLLSYGHWSLSHSQGWPVLCVLLAWRSRHRLAEPGRKHHGHRMQTLHVAFPPITRTVLQMQLKMCGFQPKTLNDDHFNSKLDSMCWFSHRCSQGWKKILIFLKNQKNQIFGFKSDFFD